MTDVSAITTRLIAMCESITGITSADDVLPDCLGDADLPYMFISEGAATHSSANNDGTVETAREWLLVLYVKAFSETDRPGEKTARDACRPFLASVVKFFWERRGLQLSTGKSPLGFMTDARLARDEGIQTLAYCNKLYAGVPFRLTVSYTDDLTLF